MREVSSTFVEYKSTISPPWYRICSRVHDKSCRKSLIVNHSHTTAATNASMPTTMKTFPDARMGQR